MRNNTRSIFAVSLLAILTLCIAVPTASAQPSPNLSDYVLFASREIRTKGLDVITGDVGVNDLGGRLRARQFIVAPASTLVADIVEFDCKRNPDNTVCVEVFANTLRHGSTTPCGSPITGFATPVIADPAAACGYPNPFPACDSAADITVNAGDTLALAPGTYGDLRVKGNKLGGFLVSGTVELAPGTYNFCNVRIARGGQMLFTGPGGTTVNVDNRLLLKNNSFTGPDAGSGLNPSDIQFYVDGRSHNLGRSSTVEAHICAPEARLKMSKGGVYTGTFVADRIRTDQVTVDRGL